jgi:hypothetical protein
MLSPLPAPERGYVTGADYAGIRGCANECSNGETVGSGRCATLQLRISLSPDIGLPPICRQSVIIRCGSAPRARITQQVDQWVLIVVTSAFYRKLVYLPGSLPRAKLLLLKLILAVNPTTGTKNGDANRDTGTTAGKKPRHLK